MQVASRLCAPALEEPEQRPGRTGLASPLAPTDFRLLFESAPGLYLVLTPEFKIAAVSDAYLCATMTKREEILGRDIFEVFPNNPNDPAATGIRNLRASLERVVRHCVSDAMAVQKYDIRRPESEGGGFEERYWSPVNFAVCGTDQNVAYIMHRAEDVTEFVRLKQLGARQEELTHKLLTRGEQMEAEIFVRAQEIQEGNRRLRDANAALQTEIAERSRAEEELRIAQEKLQDRYQARSADLDLANEKVLQLAAIVESSEDAIISRTFDGVVTSWNSGAERLFGYSSDEILGQSGSALVPPDRIDEWLTVTERIRQGESVPSFETTRRRKDGSQIQVSLSISPIRDREGRIVGVSTISRDISRRTRLEQQLRQSQKMETVGQLAGGVAHDFNNLLAIILGFCEFLEDDPALSSDSREMANEIHKAGDRAAALTRQLLAFSRQQVLQPKLMNLNEVVTETGKMLERLIGEDVSLATSLCPNLWPVKVDAGQMEQVLMNLAVNARDAMPQGGKLTIETANVELDESYSEAYLDVKPGRYVVMSVSDTGCGMDEQIKARIFEPFFTTKAAGKGTGLGLATVFGIVKQSDGHVTVYSEPDKGTTFRIYLPKVETVTESATGKKPQAVPTRGTETVLVVEDADMVRSLAARILRSQGYAVLEASSGGEALQICERHQGPIHLVLTDVVMPEMSGRQLAERLHALHPNLAVLYMSGYTDDAVVRHGILEAETNFIQKPFSHAALSQKIRDILDWRI